ncbi:MAG: hypothetical protein ACOC36_06525 [Fibrobacterota bacterium]
MKAAFRFLLFTIVLCAACSDNPVAGNGSEIVNGRVASGVPGMTVEAYPVDFVPDSTPLGAVVKTYTDSSGRFSLKVDSGSSYNLFIRDTVAGIGALVPDVKNGDRLGSVQLTDLGGVEISLDTDNYRSYRIYAAGTPYSLYLYEGGSALISNVPQGKYELFCIEENDVVTVPPVVSNPGSTDSVVVDVKSVEVKSSDSTPVRFTY